MAEKCQLTRTNVPVTCETYLCTKRVSWAIGRPDGPAFVQQFFCDECIRDMLDNLPEELRPEPEAEIRAMPEDMGEPKTYACKYCGEEFDSPTKVGSHTRYCEARKEAMANGET